jgi:hypothetical protein
MGYEYDVAMLTAPSITKMLAGEDIAANELRIIPG